MKRVRKGATHPGRTAWEPESVSTTRCRLAPHSTAPRLRRSAVALLRRRTPPGRVSPAIKGLAPKAPTGRPDLGPGPIRGQGARTRLAPAPPTRCGRCPCSAQPRKPLCDQRRLFSHQQRIAENEGSAELQTRSVTLYRFTEEASQCQGAPIAFQHHRTSSGEG